MESLDKDIETREVIQCNVPGFPGEDEGQSDGFVFSKETNSEHETMRHRYVGGQTFARPPVVSVSTETETEIESFFFLEFGLFPFQLQFH